MAVKCNITQHVLGKLARAKWGFTKNPDFDRAIVETYIEFLNCPIRFTPCQKSDIDCTSSIIVFRCEFNVLSMTFYINDDGNPYFSINVGNYVGGTEPFSYQWFYDEEVFTAEGELDTESIILAVNEGKSLEDLVSPITVIITDANGCEDTKICYITPEGLKCSNNYEPCPNPIDLMVVNLFVQCPPPTGLIVTKKI